MTEDQMDKQDLTSLSEDERFQMLLLASVEGRTNIVNEILASCIPKKGSASAPSLSRVDSGGLSALHHAVLHRHLDVVRLLLRAGAPADLFAGEGGPHVGKTAWGLLPEVDKLKEGEAKAEKSASDNDADTQEALLAARRVFGAELLQCAALGDVERTQQLLRSGVSPHVQLGTANAGGKDQTVAELALELGGSALNNPAVALLVDACGDEPSSGKPSPSSAPPTQQQRQDVATISSMPFDLMFRTEDSTVENDRSNSQKDDWISGLATPTFVRYHIRVSVEPVGGVAPEWCPFGDEDEEVDEENASPSPSSSPQSQEAQSPPRTACPSYLIRRRFREFVDLLGKWHEVALVEARLCGPPAGDGSAASAPPSPVAAAIDQLPPLPDASVLSWFTNTASATQEVRGPALAEWLTAAAAQPALRRTSAFHTFLIHGSLPPASRLAPAFMGPVVAADAAISKALCLALKREAAAAI